MLDTLSHLFEVAGPTGFVIVIMGLLVVAVFGLAWKVWGSNSGISKQLADTQEKLVNYVTLDATQMRAALDANTKSNVAASTSAVMVKGSMDALLAKLGSDPGCKIADPKIVCKAHELGMTTEAFTKMLQELKDAKDESNKLLAAIKDGQDSAAKELKETAMATAKEVVSTAEKAAQVVMDAAAERRRIHNENDAVHTAALKEELIKLRAEPAG